MFTTTTFHSMPSHHLYISTLVIGHQHKERGVGTDGGDFWTDMYCSAMGCGTNLPTSKKMDWNYWTCIFPILQRLLSLALSNVSNPPIHPYILFTIVYFSSIWFQVNIGFTNGLGDQFMSHSVPLSKVLLLICYKFGLNRTTYFHRSHKSGISKYKNETNISMNIGRFLYSGHIT